MFTQDDLKLGPAETFRRLAPRQVVPARLLEAQRDQELRVARAPDVSTIAPVARALEPSSVIGEASQDDLFQAGPQNGLRAGEGIFTLIYDDGWPTDFDFEAIIQNASGDG